MSNRPLLLLCIIFSVGILTGSYITLPLAPLLVTLACLLVATVYCYIKELPTTRWLLVLLCLLLGTFHINMWDKSKQTNLTSYIDQGVQITGTVVREPDIRAGKVSYLLETHTIQLKADKITAKGLVRLTVYDQETIFSYGDVIEASGQLQTAKTPGNPGQFDYKEYLDRRGIHMLMSVWQGQDVKLLGQVNSGVMGWALSAKGHLLKVLVETLPAEQSALVQGMLFGSRGLIDNNISADFQATSLVHVLCVSGFHVGLVLGAFLFLLHLFKVPLRLQAPLSSIVIIFYAAITGFGPSVLRASIMGLMVLWARHFGRERDWPTAMASAVVVILFIWPRAMWEPGFQLSFAVAWGILYLTPSVEKLFSHWPRSLVVAASVPVVAELTAVPLVTYHFNMISLVGVVTNILAAPLITAVMMFSGLSVLVGLIFSPLAAIINVSTSLLLDLLLALVKLLAGLPHAAWFLPTPPLLAVVLFYLILAQLPKLVGTNDNETLGNKTKYLVLAGALILIVVIVLPWSRSDHYLTVHFIDVGQGDAALIQTASGKNMLIDTGGWAGEFENDNGAGSKVVLPYLQRLGINWLDVLILSHPHEDHCGGAKTIIDKLPVGLVLIAPQSQLEEPDDAYHQLMAQMEEQQLTVMSAKAGQGLRLDDNLAVNILAPSVTKQKLNNISLLVRIDYQQCSFLFTGDIEGDQQQILASSNNNLQADVLKVPHHGSGNFAPEFIKAVSPKLAVISVGEKNRFGHPAPATLKELTDIGAKIYRTDINGAVIINTDGQSIWVDTGRKSE